MKEYNIAVVGASGLVGETIVDILNEKDIAIKTLYPLASEKSIGKSVTFNNKKLDMLDLAEFDFSKVDVAFFCVSNELAKKYVPLATDAGVVVIDNSSQYRYDADVPLVIPSVNPEDMIGYKNTNVIANPNCSTIQMLVAIKPIYDAVGITCIHVSTYQAVSGAGSDAINELASQTTALLSGKEITTDTFKEQIAFNVLASIDSMQQNGYSREEMKMVLESKKILHDNAIVINPTAARVPVFFGHCEAIAIETVQPMSAADAIALLSNIPGIKVVQDDPLVSPLKYGSNTDDVYIGRIRQGIDNPNILNMWVVADNVRKGAALNAVQIFELIIALESNKKVKAH